MEYQPSTRARMLVLIVSLALIVFGIFSTLAFSAPSMFPVGAVFEVEEGETLSEIADSLKSGGFIRSESVFIFVVKTLFLKDTGAVAGDYAFSTKLDVFPLAKRIVTGDFHLEPIKTTIPEGLNKFEVANVLKTRLPSFDSEKFVALAEEGYLFPDTYFFAPNTTPEKAVETMRKNFDAQIEPYAVEISESNRSLAHVIKMASIVETEARQTETRKIIAGILWRRFDTGMPLQVDVSFKYINGKGTSELTEDDLAIDSPYNSYKFAGLPPTPIANPGLDSILATISPTETPYFYFLSDEDGVMHYATTFEEHKKNKLLYLR